MTIGSTEAVINSAYAALTPSGGQESEIPAGLPFHIVVKVQAGATIVGLGAAYRLHVLLQDVSNFTVAVNHVFTGSLNSPSWPKANADALFSIPATSGPADTVYKILAVLSIGVTDTDISSFESTPIVVGV